MQEVETQNVHGEQASHLHGRDVEAQGSEMKISLGAAMRPPQISPDLCIMPGGEHQPRTSHL